MRRVEQLLSVIRRATDNLAFTDETGIQDNEIIQYLNDGQERIQSLVLKEHSEVFLAEQLYDVVQNQSEYDIPSDCFMGTRIEKVEYSRTGLARDFYPLQKRQLIERDDYQQGQPWYYIRRDTQVLIQPKPDFGGTLRITYQKALARLDKRRATVLSASLDTVNRTITSLTFDSTLEIDATSIIDEGYISIIDKDGNIFMKAIPVSEVSETTGVVTIYPGFVYAVGETLPAGSFAVLGKRSTTESDLPDVCEKYLITFSQKRLKARDSSQDVVTEDAELRSMEADIVTAYAEPDMDVVRVPMINQGYVDSGAW